MQFENMKNYMLYDLERDGRHMVGVMAFNAALDRLYRIGGAKRRASCRSKNSCARSDTTPLPVTPRAAE